jgi:hypothetical protein
MDIDRDRKSPCPGGPGKGRRVKRKVTWRLSRSDAMRRLVEMGLKARGVKAVKPLAIFFVLLGLCAAATPGGAQQDWGTGNSILPGCRAGLAGQQSEPAARGFCMGIVEAYLSLQPPYSAWCKPQGVTVGQGVRVAVSFIDRNPGRLHERFTQLVVDAFREAWPCPS